MLQTNELEIDEEFFWPKMDTHLLKIDMVQTLNVHYGFYLFYQHNNFRFADVFKDHGSK